MTKFKTILADPPWQFGNRSGKVAPEHERLMRYETMPTSEIAKLPVRKALADIEFCHLYLWIPNTLLADGLEVMASWGFTYKTQIIWHKVARNGNSDRRCCGFYFRNVTESCLFGIHGKERTIPPYNIPNYISSTKREHSRKPDEMYDLIERCSYPPYAELFARRERPGWTQFGDQLADSSGGDLPGQLKLFAEGDE